jgi:hypothetical protein
MEKRGLLMVILSVLILPLISAQQFSVYDFFSYFSPDTVFFFLTFVIIMILFYYPLTRVFKGNNTLAAMISVAATLLVEYWFFLVGFDPSYIFYAVFGNIGLDSGAIFFIGTIAFIAFVLFIGFKFGWIFLWFIIGGILALGSFTDLIYEKNVAFIIGIICIGIGFWILYKKNPRV